jgi:hypothetical protein
MFRTAVALVLLTVATGFAISAEQDDWSGGPRQQGPVRAFGINFSESVNIDWSYADRITLSTDPASCLVADSIDGVTSVYPADIDGDGDQDIAGSAIDAGDVVWWENTDGYGFAWEEHVVERDFPAVSSVATADIDGDGDIDLLAAAKTQYGGRDVAWWENLDGLGGDWAYHSVSNVFPGGRAACPFDIDGDGDMDIVGASSLLDQIVWWENLSGGGYPWEIHVIGDSFNGAWTLNVADIDLDGDPDVVAGAFYDDDVAWFENTDSAGGSWARHDITTDFDGVYFIDTFDIDGDGDPDVLGAASIADELVWWENRGGEFAAHVVNDSFDGAVCIHGCDIDADGDGDVLAAGVHDDIVALYENREGNWIESVLAASFDGAFSVSSGDFNGDGEPDPLGAAMHANLVVWWDCSPGVGYLESSILYTGSDPAWGIIDWMADVPQGSQVAFQIRASDDFTDMGPWSDLLLEPCRLSGIIQDDRSYVQYRVLMQSEGSAEIPTVELVEISWVSTGTEETASPVPQGTRLMAVTPNPSVSAPVISFHLEANCGVRFEVYDISGRLVWAPESAVYPAGYHQIPAGEFLPGIYVCRMYTADCTFTERFAVTR